MVFPEAECVIALTAPSLRCVVLWGLLPPPEGDLVNRRLIQSDTRDISFVHTEETCEFKVCFFLN